MSHYIILLSFRHLVNFKIFITSFTKENTIFAKFQKMKLHYVLS